MFRAKNSYTVNSKLSFTDCLAEPISPTNTVIAFDLHNVIFKKKYNEIVVIMLKSLKLSVLPTLINPKFWHKVYKLQTRTKVAEDLFIKLTDSFPNISKYRKEFISLTNAQKPILSTVKLLKELKSQGYKLFILSNIGSDTLTELSQKFPEIINLFDGAFPARPDDNYCQKPDPRFYESFKEYLELVGQSGKQILFVDDLQKNVSAARRKDIASVRFTTCKRLRATFKDLHVLKN